MKIRTETNKIEAKKIKQRIYRLKSWFFEKNKKD
jgi:hypothetical protein